MLMVGAAPHATGHQVVVAAAAALGQYHLLPLFLVEAQCQAKGGVGHLHGHAPTALSGFVVEHPHLPTAREHGRMGGPPQLEG